MSFSYTDPSASPTYEVRFMVGDTQPKKHYLEDEEIAYLLNKNSGDVGITAIRACEAICARVSRMRDESVGSVSVSLQQVYQNYMQTLGMLRAQYNESASIVPFAGGLTLSEKAAARSDRDFNRPHFENDMLQGWAGPYVAARRLGSWYAGNLDEGV